MVWAELGHCGWRAGHHRHHRGRHWDIVVGGLAIIATAAAETGEPMRSEMSQEEPVWAYMQSWAGLTRHREVKVGDCTRKGRPHVKVRMLENALRFVAGRTYYPPSSAVEPRFEE